MLAYREWPEGFNFKAAHLDLPYRYRLEISTAGGQLFQNLVGELKEGDNPVVWNGVNDAGQAFMATGEGIELMANFPRIVEPGVRRKIMELIRAVAEE